MINVTFHQRKPRDSGNFSIEFIFADIRKRLAGDIKSEISISKLVTSGPKSILKNSLQARSDRGKINHVTGDTHYQAILLDRNNTILTIHDCLSMERLSGLKKYLYRLLYLSLPAAKSRFITVVSSSTKKDVLKYIDYPEDRIKVIPVAISGSFKFRPKSEPSKPARVLQIGTAENKNLERLIQAISGLDCELRIIGILSPEQTQLLKQQKINFSSTSNISESEIIEEYASADMLTFISTKEGFGMPIIEAQAIGRPVITSNISSMPYVAGDAAILVDPYNLNEIRAAVTKLISEKNERDDLVEKGLKNVQRFDADVIANQYLELYKTISQETEKGRC